ncbi:MAG: HipA domain-containing protein [Deltaproteobacteria bacterium]|nr:HipA domain-containing protein [Deltaproteobacteria bacterium]
MNTCPITYQPCEDRFSSEGLKRLARGLQDLESLPYTAAEQLHEAAARAPKMSIQGVQPKLSARLNVRKNHFEIVDKGGRFILKPQNPQFPELPENEDLSMRLAAAVGIDVPIHGMVYSKDNTFTYFIKRFDRIGRRRKLAVEDFAQLSDLSRETKYDSSMEKVVRVIETFCTFPAVDKIKLFRLTLVNFLIGNEDMHLKNFSLITRDDKIELSPAYDLISTTIALANPQEEIALPLMEKKSGLNRKTIIWNELIHVSFLSLEMKEKYLKLLNTREALIFP